MDHLEHVVRPGISELAPSYYWCTGQRKWEKIVPRFVQHVPPVCSKFLEAKRHFLIGGLKVVNQGRSTPYAEREQHTTGSTEKHTVRISACINKFKEIFTLWCRWRWYVNSKFCLQFGLFCYSAHTDRATGLPLVWITIHWKVSLIVGRHRYIPALATLFIWTRISCSLWSCYQEPGHWRIIANREMLNRYRRIKWWLEMALSLVDEERKRANEDYNRSLNRNWTYSVTK